MAMTMRAERPNTTKNAHLETEPIDVMEKAQIRSSYPQCRSKEKKRDKFKALHETIEKRCRGIPNTQERRDIRKKLWHLSRDPDSKGFNTLIDIEYVHPELLAHIKAFQQGKDREKKYVPVLPERSNSPPCLQCSLKGNGMSCSVQFKGREKVVKCQRCQRNGEEFCVRQWDDPIHLLEEIGDDNHDGQELNIDRAEHDDEYLTRRVYCHDNILQKDKPRLCAVTRALLGRYQKAEDICGILMLRTFHHLFSSRGSSGKKEIVLPVWHDNDKPTNRRDLEYRPQTHADYFAAVQAQKEERRQQMAAAAAERPEKREAERRERRRARLKELSEERMRVKPS